MHQDLHLFPSGNVPYAALVCIAEPAGVHVVPNGESIPVTRASTIRMSPSAQAMAANMKSLLPKPYVLQVSVTAGYEVPSYPTFQPEVLQRPSSRRRTPMTKHSPKVSGQQAADRLQDRLLGFLGLAQVAGGLHGAEVGFPDIGAGDVVFFPRAWTSTLMTLPADPPLPCLPWQRQVALPKSINLA